MKQIDLEGIVHDAAGETWECRWRVFLKGYPLLSTTKVRLRKIGTDEYTHFVMAHYPADRFHPDLIDGKFTPKKEA